MGLANLVPGISGGTMLVAAGVYRRFIDAMSELTRLRFRADAISTLAIVIAGAAVAVVAGSGLISAALVEARWVMYSLFIGLTLGGAPVLWKLVRPARISSIIGLMAGFVLMLGVTMLQSGQASGSGGADGMVRLALAGAAAASAMILPGVSGAYLLLLFGAYEPILAAISDTTDAVLAGDVAGVVGQLGVIVPVGIGVVGGVVGVSNILHFILHRYERTTLGFLLGLLLAAPAGLYPFVESVRPNVGDVIKGQIVTEETIDEYEPRDWPVRRFTPSAGHVLGALGLVIVGFGTTLVVARLGGEESSPSGDGSDT